MRVFVHVADGVEVHQRRHARSPPPSMVAVMVSYPQRSSSTANDHGHESRCRIGMICVMALDGHMHRRPGSRQGSGGEHAQARGNKLRWRGRRSTRPNRPAIAEPRMGRKTAQTSIASQPFIAEIDVLNRDGAAVAEIDDQDGKADGSLGGGHGQDEHARTPAPPSRPDRCRKSRRSSIFTASRINSTRHQDDDDVLAVQENA